MEIQVGRYDAIESKKSTFYDKLNALLNSFKYIITVLRLIL